MKQKKTDRQTKGHLTQHRKIGPKQREPNQKRREITFQVLLF